MRVIFATAAILTIAANAPAQCPNGVCGVATFRPGITRQFSRTVVRPGVVQFVPTVAVQVAPYQPMPAGPPVKAAPAPAPKAQPCPCGGVARVALVQTAEPRLAAHPVRTLLAALLHRTRSTLGAVRGGVHRELHRIVDR